MSLMQLLTMGRSVTTVRGVGTAYKLKPDGLPKFAQVGRPISLRPAPIVEPEHVAPLFSEQGASPVANRAAQAPRLVERAIEKPALAPLPGPACPAPRRDHARDRRKFLKRLFSPRPPATHKQLVQAELGLESVKVVRNDLSEHEFTPVRRMRRESAGRETEPKSRIRELWNRVIGRFVRGNARNQFHG